MTPRPGDSGDARNPHRAGTGAAEPGTKAQPETKAGGTPKEDPDGPAGAAERRDEDETVTDGLEEDLQHDLEHVVDAARRERDEYLDMLRRVQADFENYKKRMIRQQTELLERAAQGLIDKMLPALDAFALAREHLSDVEDLTEEGRALLQASALLFDTLAKEGLERVDDLGKPFDPTTHDAVEHEASEPGEDAAPQAGTSEGSGDARVDGPVVAAVLRPGYRWKGRVLRPALVRVKG